MTWHENLRAQPCAVRMRRNNWRERPVAMWLANLPLSTRVQTTLLELNLSRSWSRFKKPNNFFYCGETNRIWFNVVCIILFFTITAEIHGVGTKEKGNRGADERRNEQRNRGTEEQRNRGTEQHRNIGTEEQRNRGTEEQRNRGTEE